MSARCDLSDLPVEQCACRVHGPKADPRPTSSGRAVAAAFPGHCPECGEYIDPGDPLLFSGSWAGWVHEECA